MDTAWTFVVLYIIFIYFCCCLVFTHKHVCNCKSQKSHCECINCFQPSESKVLLHMQYSSQSLKCLGQYLANSTIDRCERWHATQSATVPVQLQVCVCVGELATGVAYLCATRTAARSRWRSINHLLRHRKLKKRKKKILRKSLSQMWRLIPDAPTDNRVPCKCMGWKKLK